MSHHKDHFPERNHNQHGRLSRDSRKLGGGVLEATELNRPSSATGVEREVSLNDQLSNGARGAVLAQFARMQDVLQKKGGGEKLQLNADTIRLAYIAQKARLKDKRITDEMTRKQLMYELMAKAILFAPQVSDAKRTNRNRESKAVLSQYNDIFGEIVRSLPAKIVPGYKTAIVDALVRESALLNKRIGHSSEVTSKDTRSGINEIQSTMNGVSYEIAPVNGLRRDPRLEVVVPEDTESDLEGIDMIVKRREDNSTILIDTKTRGSYLASVAEEMGLNWVDEAVAGTYYFTNMHEVVDENGETKSYPHYLLNANSFSQIPAEGFDFTPLGQEKLLRTVHEMLDEGGH